MNSNIRIKTKYDSLWTDLMESITNIYLFVLLFIFPFIYRNQYRDIMTVKTYFYWWITGIYVVLMCLFFLVSGRVARWIREKGWRDWSLLDVGMLLFLGMSILSWLFSSKHIGMFLGTYGRSMGLFSIILCVAAFFSISYNANLPGYYWKVLCVVLGIVSLLAVANHLGYDPLGMYAGVTGEKIYISTIGNLNVFAAYLGVILPIIMVKYLLADKRWFHGIFLFVGFMGMVASNCDSIYLVIAVAFFVLLWWCKGKTEGARLVEEILMWFFSGLLMLGIRFLCGSNHCERLQGILKVALTPRFLLTGFLIFAGIYIILHWGVNKNIWHRIRRIGLGVLVFSVILLVALMLYVNLCMDVAEAKQSLGYLWKYLYLGEQWGSRRMKVWEAAVQVFQRMSWKERLFGFGPAGFYYAAHTYLSESELAVFTWGKLLDAHNGYLQYLISIGIFGMISIYGSLVYAMTAFFKASKRENNYVVYAMAVAAFLVQAIANNPHIFIDPLLIAIVAMGYGKKRREKENEKRSND